MRIQYGTFLTVFAVFAAAAASSIEDVLVSTIFLKTHFLYLYNNKCFVRYVSQAVGWNWACDSSLEPSWPKNDGSTENFRFARPARPQRAKMCFFTT